MQKETPPGTMKLPLGPAPPHLICPKIDFVNLLKAKGACEMELLLDGGRAGYEVRVCEIIEFLILSAVEAEAETEASRPNKGG